MKVRNTYYNFINDMPDETQVQARYSAAGKPAGKKPPYTKTGAHYASGKYLAAVGNITNGPNWKGVFTPSKEGMKATALTALAGVGYALYSKKSVFLYAALGAGAGIVGYNAYKMFIQPNLKPKADGKEISQPGI